MGVKGLIRSLKNLTDSETHIKKWNQSCVAVDISSWLFRGAFSCAEELFQSGAKSTDKYIRFVINWASMLRYYGVEPILVFDGRRTQLKANEENRRHESRRENLAKARDLAQQSRGLQGEEKQRCLRAAADYMRRCIHITWEMCQRTIKALKECNFRVIVAPYEADAQVAYLCKIGWAAAAVTEDSDVIVYSASCKKPFPVILKLEATGMCQEFCLDSEHLLQKIAALGTGKKGSLLDSLQKMFSHSDKYRLFVQMACLTGCDYIESLPGVGIVSAAKMVVDMIPASSEKRLERVLYHYENAGGSRKGVVPEGYLHRLEVTELNFYCYRVYDPTKAVCVFLNDPSASLDYSKKWKHFNLNQALGEPVPETLAPYICNGVINPNSIVLPDVALPSIRALSLPPRPQGSNTSVQSLDMCAEVPTQQRTPSIQPSQHQNNSQPVIDVRSPLRAISTQGHHQKELQKQDPISCGFEDFATETFFAEIEELVLNNDDQDSETLLPENIDESPNQMNNQNGSWSVNDKHLTEPFTEPIRNLSTGISRQSVTPNFPTTKRTPVQSWHGSPTIDSSMSSDQNSIQNTQDPCKLTPLQPINPFAIGKGISLNSQQSAEISQPGYGSVTKDLSKNASQNWLQMKCQGPDKIAPLQPINPFAIGKGVGVKRTIENDLPTLHPKTFSSTLESSKCDSVISPVDFRSIASGCEGFGPITTHNTGTNPIAKLSHFHAAESLTLGFMSTPVSASNNRGLLTACMKISPAQREAKEEQHRTKISKIGHNQLKPEQNTNTTNQVFLLKKDTPIQEKKMVRGTLKKKNAAAGTPSVLNFFKAK